MTAFSRESASANNGELTVELRSVNHRYLDCSFKLPDALRNAEAGLRERATARLSRGKLDCLFRFQSGTVRAAGLVVDHRQVQKVVNAALEVSALLPGSQPINPLELLQFPGVWGTAEADETTLVQQANALFDAALKTLLENRAREGAKLAVFIRDRLAQVEAATAAARAEVPALRKQQQARLRARLAELQVEVDQGRLEQELVYLAHKADVEEELDRLQAHIGEVRLTLNKGGPCGRRLDFLMQELNREANTLSSKSTASSSTHNAVELKVLIEQMREQIQNIE
jgi:uncharacterized protein (TIGR00255 family)